jgi:hypothetical protein
MVRLLRSFSFSVIACTIFIPSPYYRVSTSGYSEYGDSAELSSGSSICVIEKSESPNPFLEREIKFKIVTILKNKGYQIASFDNADFYLLYAYGIGSGQTVTDVHSQTYTSHKLNIYTGRIETMPRTRTFTSKRTKYDRWLFIKVIDAKEFRETRATHAIWVGETNSRGSKRDIREVIDYLLIPTFEHFGEDTGKAVRHTMFRGNSRVKELNKAARKELAKFSSKNKVTREATLRPEQDYSTRTQITAGERVYPDCDLKIRELLAAGEDVALCINITEPSNACSLSQDAIQNWQKAMTDEVGNFYESVVFSYYNKFDNFTLVDRNNLVNVLKEHQLSQSGLTDKETRIEVGKLVGINYLVNIGYNRYCSLPRINDITTIKIIEIETGKIMAVDTIENRKMYNPKSLQLETIKTVLNGQEVLVGSDGRTLYRKQTQ